VRVPWREHAGSVLLVDVVVDVELRCGRVQGHHELKRGGPVVIVERLSLEVARRINDDPPRHLLLD
jgi:hypothetical protein